MANKHGTETTTTMEDDKVTKTNINGVTEYTKEMTFAVEVQGEGELTTMGLLKEVKKECGTVVGCRAKGERKYEITMKDEEGSVKLLDGIKLKDCTILARKMVTDEMVVSFMNLPVYLKDEDIVTKLREWGVKPISLIRRKMWPGTDIVDGTRYLRVKFNKEVKSLPYSTRFNTLEGAEYFRVIHDRQVQVCRICLQTGHVLRECPEFKCFRCGKTGHYARECVERRREQETREESMEPEHERGEEENRDENEELMGLADDEEEEMYEERSGD